MPSICGSTGSDTLLPEGVCPDDIVSLSFNFDYKTKFSEKGVDIDSEFSVGSTQETWVYGNTTRLKNNQYLNPETSLNDLKFSKKSKLIAEGERFAILDDDGEIWFCEIEESKSRVHGDKIDGVIVSYFLVEEAVLTPSPSPEDTDNDGFVDGVSNYQIWTKSGGVDLTDKKGRKLSNKTSSLWDAIKAVQTDTGFSILIEGDRKKQGKYRIWKTNENGRLQSQSPWKSAQQMFESGSEDTFETDFNGNDQIGFIAPTGITLSTFSFNENISSGAVVAQLSSIDVDPSDTHTYSLVSGSGDTNNSAFTIQGDQLKINASPDYETNSSYSIRLRTTDSSGGLSYEEPFTLTVNDLDEPVEPVVQVQDLDGDGFVDGITNYQVLTNGSGVDLINKKGRKFSDKSSRMWDAVKAITNDESIQVLIEGTKKMNGKFRMWFAKSNSGKIFSQTSWKKESWMTKQGYENIFDHDINDNGVIGS